MVEEYLYHVCHDLPRASVQPLLEWKTSLPRLNRQMPIRARQNPSP